MKKTVFLAAVISLFGYTLAEAQQYTIDPVTGQQVPVYTTTTTAQPYSGARTIARTAAGVALGAWVYNEIDDNNDDDDDDDDWDDDDYKKKDENWDQASENYRKAQQNRQEEYRDSQQNRQDNRQDRFNQRNNTQQNRQENRQGNVQNRQQNRSGNQAMRVENRQNIQPRTVSRSGARRVN